MSSEIDWTHSITQVDTLIDSQPLEASERLLALIKRAKLINDAAVLGDLYCKLGNCRIALHDPIGIRDFETALAYAEESGDLYLKVNVLHGLARSFITFGDTHTALQYCEMAIELGRSLDDKCMFAQVLMTLGLIFAATQQFERSLTIYAEAATLCRNNADQIGLARALNNWSDALTIFYEFSRDNGLEPEIQSLDLAVSYGRQALALAEECKLFRFQLLAIETLAHAMEVRGMFAVALEELELGMSKLAGHGFIKEELDIQVRLGALELQLKLSIPAISRLSKAYELALQLGNYPHLADLLRILSTAHEAVGDFAAALGVHKEFHLVTLKSRDQRAQISAQIFAAKLDLEKLQRESESHKSRVNQLENYNRSLNVQVREDSLTGLPNRRALDEHLEKLAVTHIGIITFALIDIDYFKRVNDTFSHLIGDEVLRHFGKLFRSCLRSGDMAARIGGEEFALVLDRARGSRSIDVCERLRKAIQSYDWNVLAPNLHVTASFGITHVQASDDLKSMMTRADGALYRAKQNGRNRIEKA
ncbi:GGDEF domain-containing protein [Undibacterium parvum]|uniref:diguanylate cyclase n=1 Tax=Undibacterium parvum TaxID=401471 RepID=A0A3S9HK42_9BURK|nr:GGDEF domain-containing protein [Undibacterium parvum]AZP12474.1 GGDEF domain-containing protein [Undibacterium parvum]